MFKPIRVLFAIPELDTGGPDRVFFELISNLDRNKFLPVLLVSKRGGRYFNSLPKDVEIHTTDAKRYPIWYFARVIDTQKPDLIITTLRMNATASAARYLQVYRPPLITRQANAIGTNFLELRKRSRLKYGIAEQLVRFLLRTPDALVAQSLDMGIELQKIATIKQKIAVIGNPVSIHNVIKMCAVQQLLTKPKRNGDPAIVAVGRLSTQKGFDVLLIAFAMVLQEYPQAKLTIWGEGPDREKLETQVKALKIDGSVILPGHTENILAEVNAADLFVSSSRYEGFSNAILEAMALGKPVVATDSEGGTKDMIIDNETGILARPEDVTSLADAIIRALKGNLSELGKAGQQHVGGKFSMEHILEKYQELFLDLLKAKQNVKYINSRIDGVDHP